MKAKNLLSLFIALFFTVGIYAGNPETITLSNIEQTETGYVKEFLSCDKDTNTPIAKTVYEYDGEDRLLEKAIYNWDAKDGWVGSKKYVYAYDENNRPVAPQIIKWNNKTKKWSDQ